MTVLTRWFNAGAEPPERGGWYDFRSIDPPNWTWGVKECRAFYDGRSWEYPNNRPDPTSSTIKSYGCFANYEWRGIHKESQ